MHQRAICKRRPAVQDIQAIRQAKARRFNSNPINSHLILILLALLIKFFIEVILVLLVEELLAVSVEAVPLLRHDEPEHGPLVDRCHLDVLLLALLLSSQSRPKTTESTQDKPRVHLTFIDLDRAPAVLIFIADRLVSGLARQHFAHDLHMPLQPKPEGGKGSLKN